MRCTTSPMTDNEYRWLIIEVNSFQVSLDIQVLNPSERSGKKYEKSDFKRHPAFTRGDLILST